MNDPFNRPVEPVSVEEMVKLSLCDVRKRVRNRFQKCEDMIHESPRASVLGGVGVGYLLHRLPVRAILVTQVRVLSALAPPALFLYGAAKLFGFLQRQRPTEPNFLPSSTSPDPVTTGSKSACSGMDAM